MTGRKGAVAPADGRHGPSKPKVVGRRLSKVEVEALKPVQLPPPEAVAERQRAILPPVRSRRHGSSRHRSRHTDPNGDMEQTFINYFTGAKAKFKHRYLRRDWSQPPPAPPVWGARARNGMKLRALSDTLLSADDLAALYADIERQFAAEHQRDVLRAIRKERRQYRTRRLANAVSAETVAMSVDAILSGLVHPHAVVGVLPDGRVECILWLAETSKQARIMARKAAVYMSDEQQAISVTVSGEAAKRVRHRGVYGSRDRDQAGTEKIEIIQPSGSIDPEDRMMVPTQPLELADITKLAKTRAGAAIEALTLALNDKKTSVAAAQAILDRAYGKAPLSVTVSDPDKVKAAQEMTSTKLLEILVASGVTQINGKSVESVMDALKAKEKGAPFAGSALSLRQPDQHGDG